MTPLSLIGCGWLGRHLIPTLATHYRLLATVKHSESADTLPIPAYLYDWTNAPLPTDIATSPHILIAIPPSAGGREYYAQHLQQLGEQLSQQRQQTGKTILISSTSAYPQEAGEYDENSATDPNNLIVQGEQALLRTQPHSIILRCGGLIGANRSLAKHWFGKPCDLPNARLNLIHQQDIANALLTLLQHPIKNTYYNLVHPQHPYRHDYYRHEAQQQHAAPPHFTQTTTPPQRLINGKRITHDYPFRYQHPPI